MEPDANGADHLAVHYTDYSLSDGHATFFVRTADIEREERLYPPTVAPPPAPSKEPNRPLRRRSTKYVWKTRGSKYDQMAIGGEIARRCIDPKTGRVDIPKNRSKLARDMLQWCEDKFQCQPADSEMREAVKAICDALLQSPAKRKI